MFFLLHYTYDLLRSWHFFRNFQGPDWRFGSSFFPGTAHKPQKGFSSTWITHLPSVSINLTVSVRGFTFAKDFFSCEVVWCDFNWPRLNWQKGGVTPCHPKLSCCCVWWLVKCQHVLPPWLNIGPGSLRCSPYENERSSESRILCLAQVTRCLEVSSDFWELQKCTATAVFWNFESWRMRLRKGWKDVKGA